jgi:hypothetical protein
MVNESVKDKLADAIRGMRAACDRAEQELKVPQSDVINAIIGCFTWGLANIMADVVAANRRNAARAK